MKSRYFLNIRNLIGTSMVVAAVAFTNSAVAASVEYSFTTTIGVTGTFTIDTASGVPGLVDAEFGGGPGYTYENPSPFSFVKSGDANVYNQDDTFDISLITGDAGDLRFIFFDIDDAQAGGSLYGEVNFVSGAEFDGTTASIGSPEWSVVNPVPVPAAAWLFGSALIGLVGIKRRK